ncbi:MAG TPA: hypothetical protein VEW46_08550 [Pyrinomonadaceae bacterium]|nr:hypothetical protein [Pyrinomonadaceae bacterium]
MTPCEGHFLASFSLGDKAVAAAHKANLPASSSLAPEEPNVYRPRYENTIRAPAERNVWDGWICENYQRFAPPERGRLLSA